MTLCDPGYHINNISNIGNKLSHQVQVCTITPDSSQAVWEVSMVLSLPCEVVCVHVHSCNPGCQSWADGAHRWTLRSQCTPVDMDLASSCCQWVLQLGQFPVSSTECENSHPEELTKPAPRLGPVITVFEWSFIGTQSHLFILVLPTRVFSHHDG